MRKPLKKIRISAKRRVLQIPKKQLKMGTFDGCLWYGTAQTAQFRAMRIISQTSQHPITSTKKTNHCDHWRRCFAKLWRNSKQTYMAVALCTTLRQ